MPVHHVENGGMVVAYEPTPADRFVVLIIGTPAGSSDLHTVPLRRYDQVLAFAKKIATWQHHPVTLLPITAREYVERYKDSLTELWGELPQDVRETAIAAYEGRYQ